MAPLSILSVLACKLLLFALSRQCVIWGTGIRGLMRDMATLPQGNQELLMVRDKVGSLG